MNGHKKLLSKGMFLRHTIDITDWVISEGENLLAVLVHPPDHPGRIPIEGGQGGDHDVSLKNNQIISCKTYLFFKILRVCWKLRYRSALDWYIGVLQILDINMCILILNTKSIQYHFLKCQFDINIDILVIQASILVGCSSVSGQNPIFYSIPVLHSS